MKLKPFKLERYFAKYEFSARYLLSSSDCDGLRLAELLVMADAETRKLWDELSLGYTESPGHPLLRQEISQLYRGIQPQDCLVCVPQEGILMALNCLLQPGEHVICTFPGYQSLYSIAEGLGCEVTRWVPEEENGWRFNPALLEQHIRPNTRLLIINFPHNPTGSLPAIQDYRQIIDFARRHGLYLFSDEMYRLLEQAPEERLPAACEIYEKAISLSGVSKTLGLAGARIGWLVTKDEELIRRLAEFKDYTTICSSAPAEILALIALRSREAIIQRHIARIQRNLGTLDEFFTAFESDFKWVRPRAGTIGFPCIQNGMGSLDFCQQVMREANIMLLPSTVYDFDDRHFRLGFGRENMPEALEQLVNYLKRPGGNGPY